MYTIYLLCLIIHTLFCLCLEHQNEPDAAVCAYNVKCGDIQTFESKDLATLSNFTVLHCGACAGKCWFTNLSTSCVHIFERIATAQTEWLTFSSSFTSSYQHVQTGMTFHSNCWIWPHPVELVDRRTSFIKATNSLLEYRSVTKKILAFLPNAHGIGLTM